MFLFSGPAVWDTLSRRHRDPYNIKCIGAWEQLIIAKCLANNKKKTQNLKETNVKDSIQLTNCKNKASYTPKASTFQGVSSFKVTDD